MSLLRQSGIPEDVAQQVHERGYHAYVLHGPTPELSRAFQFTSTNGFEQYQKVLSIVQEKSAEGWEKIRGTDLDAWGRAVAANITGPGQVGALMGSVVYAQPDADCWEGTAPPRCARAELENATVAYAKSRPRVQPAAQQLRALRVRDARELRPRARRRHRPVLARRLRRVADVRRPDGRARLRDAPREARHAGRRRPERGRYGVRRRRGGGAEGGMGRAAPAERERERANPMANPMAMNPATALWARTPQFV